MAKGAEGCWFAVTVIVMSPTAELKAVPELVIVVCDPVVVERLTLLVPAVTLQVLEEPPDEVRVIEVAYPEGCNPLKYQTVFGPLMVGLTLAPPPGCCCLMGHKGLLLICRSPDVEEVVDPTETPECVP